MNVNKEYVFLKDLIIPYHPMFKGYSAEQIQKALDNSLAYNVEYLVEQTLAELGGLDHTDGNHCDYADNSDCKTASIRSYGRNRCQVTIFGVSKTTRAGISYKSGDLRVVIYNPHTAKVMYYFLPHHWWVNQVITHATQGWGYILSSYHKNTDTIPEWEQFRCNSPAECALMKSTI